MAEVEPHRDSSKRKGRGPVLINARLKSFQPFTGEHGKRSCTKTMRDHPSALRTAADGGEDVDELEQGTERLA